MKQLTGLAVYVPFTAWLTAVFTDGNALQLGWMLADIIFAPVGVVRGILMWFGLVG